MKVAETSKFYQDSEYRNLCGANLIFNCFKFVSNNRNFWSQKLNFSTDPVILDLKLYLA